MTQSQLEKIVRPAVATLFAITGGCVGYWLQPLLDSRFHAFLLGLATVFGFLEAFFGKPMLTKLDAMQQQAREIKQNYTQLFFLLEDRKRIVIRTIMLHRLLALVPAVGVVASLLAATLTFPGSDQAIRLVVAAGYAILALAIPSVVRVLQLWNSLGKLQYMLNRTIDQEKERIRQMAAYRDARPTRPLLESLPFPIGTRGRSAPRELSMR